MALPAGRAGRRERDPTRHRPAGDVQRTAVGGHPGRRPDGLRPARRSTLAPASNLTVTAYLAEGQASNNITSHPGSRTTSYLLAGNHVAADDLPGATRTDHWYFLSGVEVWPERAAGGGGHAGRLADRRPGLHHQRQQPLAGPAARPAAGATASTADVAVLNQAAGGNRVLNDGLGPNALARLDRDVLAQSGVDWLVVFEGVNDIGTAAATEAAQKQVADDLIAAYEQIIVRAHAQGIRVYGATLLPFGGNTGVRRPGGFPRGDPAGGQRLDPHQPAVSTRSSTSTWRCATRRTPGSCCRRTTSATTCTSTRSATRRWPTPSRLGCSGADNACGPPAGHPRPSEVGGPAGAQPLPQAAPAQPVGCRQSGPGGTPRPFVASPGPSGRRAPAPWTRRPPRPPPPRSAARRRPVTAQVKPASQDRRNAAGCSHSGHRGGRQPVRRLHQQRGEQQLDPLQVAGEAEEVARRSRRRSSNRTDRQRSAPATPREQAGLVAGVRRRHGHHPVADRIAGRQSARPAAPGPRRTWR